ncbi:helix-turn-helix domain-containing protein [Streptomyces mirabilis]|uniref:helix-turn-helix domain-containing protein n=2 Tax=Streptomyces mirabilis TaxID=68239 RepID=UPI0035D96124
MRGMSKQALAQAMDFDSPYVSHMESGRHKPGGDFARLADEALNAGKAIWRRWATTSRPGPRRHGERRSPTPCSLRNAHDVPLLDQLSLRCAISHRSPVALLRRRSANGFGTHEAGKLREHASRRFKSCRGHRTQGQSRRYPLPGWPFAVSGAVPHACRSKP